MAAPSSIADRAALVARVPEWAARRGRVPLAAVPCTPRGLRPVAQVAQDSAPAWVPVQALARVRDSASAQAWAAGLLCHLQVKRRARHARVRAVADARVTRRAKKVR